MSNHLTTIFDVTIGPSALHGQGVFSTRDRPVGEVLAVLDGQVVPHNGDLEFLLAHEWNAVSETHVMLRPIWTTYGFINHAAAPNLAFRLHDRALVAREPVASGAELTLDYCEHGIPAVYLASERGRYLR